MQAEMVRGRYMELQQVPIKPYIAPYYLAPT